MQQSLLLLQKLRVAQSTIAAMEEAVKVANQQARKERSVSGSYLRHVSIW